MVVVRGMCEAETDGEMAGRENRGVRGLGLCLRYISGLYTVCTYVPRKNQKEEKRRRRYQGTFCPSQIIPPSRGRWKHGDGETSTHSSIAVGGKHGPLTRLVALRARFTVRQYKNGLPLPPQSSVVYLVVCLTRYYLIPACAVARGWEMRSLGPSASR